MVLVTRVVYEVDARLGKACQINSTGATIDQELVGHVGCWHIVWRCEISIWLDIYLWTPNLGK